ncbi:MarR family transcriptional regulator [Cytobacillus firmus]|uniref:MarR family winged helix-turn-helix transcriptional regulator n=1 Tax=Cytobacillus firmus TaxID=1399 RepID=UPI00077C4E30|nr:MarR family transcriptional regulator [Cytobacillus firmus]MBG9547291.1 MarR family transcriptional regulator [Cytobacillus firmus]MBG9553512.1 MarR family transcriptional regulator [Cytobacillus firmus]MBG9556733.1 MarR family transcriptional regulator [Cytobacillus firmus]MBG9574809.1 MarR family transcriptional regulator [Cytobacillus firmus]
METFQRFFHQLVLLYRPFENRLNTELSKHQLYRAQWSIMYYMYNDGSVTLVELSHYLGVEKPTVTRTIAKLEEMGYLEPVPTKDKREKRMQLTSAGRKVYQEVRATIDEFEQEILEGISEEEQLEGIRLMSLIRKNLMQGEF